jgi:hypothetical protein
MHIEKNCALSSADDVSVIVESEYISLFTGYYNLKAIISEEDHLSSTS